MLRRVHDQLADFASGLVTDLVSASTIRTSTSGSGRPIDPILFFLHRVHAAGHHAFGQRVLLNDASAGFSSNCRLVSAIRAAEPEKHNLIELRSIFPARTSGWLRIAV